MIFIYFILGGVIIDKQLNKKITNDIHIINSEIMPEFAARLEEYHIDMVSSAFYFAGVVRNMLAEIDNKDMRAVIIRYMLDEDEHEIS